MSSYPDNYKYLGSSRQSGVEADLNDWQYDEQSSPVRMSTFPFSGAYGDNQNNPPNMDHRSRSMSFSHSNTHLRKASTDDEDDFTVRPSYATIFAVWVSSILDDVIGFACEKPHLSAASGMLLMMSASPFLALLAGTVCCALMAVLFLTCTEGALIAIFMFMFACFVISTVIVVMVTLITIYVIHATVMGIYNKIVAVRNKMAETVHRYYTVLRLLKQKDSSSNDNNHGNKNSEAKNAKMK